MKPWDTGQEAGKCSSSKQSLQAQEDFSHSKLQADSCLTLNVDLSDCQGILSLLCHSAAFMLHTSSSLRIRLLYNAQFLPRGKLSEKVCSPVLQVQPDNVTLGYFQGTHFSLSQQDCSTPSLSRWVSGDIPAFSHSYFPWSVHVRTFCLFPRVPV